tara:strand:- start:212 stop:481 length:270 start_codon:yes stop_codon:yes gene_type:complete
MSKTIILKNTRINSIVINQEKNNKGENKGFACNVDYSVLDENGNTAISQKSQKFTIDADYEAKLSANSSKIVSDFVDEIQKKMNEKEGI